MEIMLNGEKVTVTPHCGSKPGAKMSIGYETLADLAGLAGRNPTIAWRTPNKVCGLLLHNERVELVDGMSIETGVTGAP